MFSKRLLRIRKAVPVAMAVMMVAGTTVAAF